MPRVNEVVRTYAALHHHPAAAPISRPEAGGASLIGENRAMGAQAAEEFDVVVIGAGISGIAIGHHLSTRLPGTSFAVLEARADVGGTWDLFRYPGVRSDSDLQTFGFPFRPWQGAQAIADGPRILDYLRQTAAESGLRPHIRFHHRVISAAWSSEAARWRVTARRTDPASGASEQRTFSARWLFCGTGYYRYEEGHSPRFEGRERFSGTVVHPQHWPDGLDYSGRRVVVIGSGATAVTLVPEIARTAARVTMVQRTPTYVVPLPREDGLHRVLARLLGERRAFPITRRKNIARQRAVWEFAQRCPRLARRVLEHLARRRLPWGYPVGTHFDPPYDPWEQRLCVAPDGDLFDAITSGQAEVVTDHLETFTERGVRLASGREIEADLVITATGLNLELLGGIEFTVDGRPLTLPDTVAYKGFMLSGVPNLAYSIGYVNSSWTLKVELVCAHLCRLLAYMDARGYQVCRPEPSDPEMPTRPLLDFDAGYVKRSMDEMPRQGSRPPWRTSMTHAEDMTLLQRADMDHPELRFGHADAEATGPDATDPEASNGRSARQ